MSALSPREHVDFLVLGGGVAGLTFALEAAASGSVLVLTKRQRFEGTAKLIDSLSYKSVLRRGFALVRDNKGSAVHSAAAVKQGHWQVAFLRIP